MPKRTMAYWMWAMVLTVPGAVAKETTPGAADAEETRGETRGRSAVQLDKVVVTARRRDESLQDVPVSVTALDADVSGAGITQDGFRIKIWRADSGDTENVLYDNGLGGDDATGNGGTTPLGGGSIKIHAAKK